MQFSKKNSQTYIYNVITISRDASCGYSGLKAIISSIQLLFPAEITSILFLEYWLDDKFASLKHGSYEVVEILENDKNIVQHKDTSHIIYVTHLFPYRWDINDTSLLDISLEIQKMYK